MSDLDKARVVCVSMNGKGCNDPVQPVSSPSGTEPVPTLAVLDALYDITQVQMAVTFDQAVIDFVQADIIVSLINLPGSNGGSFLSFIQVSPSSYAFIYDHGDDGSGGDITFTVPAGVCTGLANGLDNTTGTLNLTLQGF